MKKTFTTRLLAVLMCVAMLATVTPIFATAESAAYLDYNATTGAVDTSREADSVNVIDEATDSFVTGWNIVKGDVEFEDRIVLPADVNLILANDATLTAKKGITVAADGDFAVYAQSNDEDTMGKLIVPKSVDEFMAGIGCTERGTCGNITIYGGAVTAQGGFDGAGIGGGYESTCGNISIHGGSITATGNQLGAGIGSGYSGECGNITIYGGTVTVESASHGAGIGSGSYGSCGEVTLAGGIVTARGGKYGAGIGGGFGASCTKVTVSGGYIKATAGTSADSIGTGYSSGVVVPVSIDDSCVSVTKDGSQYINYEPVAAVKSTCASGGALAYFKDSICGNYYTAFPFTEDGLIGDATALAAWKAEGGDGYVEKLPHADNNEDDRCDSCGAVHATYLDYNETTGKVDLEREVWGVHVVNADNTWFDFGWNVVEGDVTIEERIILPGNVNLILANGATLTAEKGIAVPRNGDFAIYAQSNDAATMGKLIVQGADEHDAGIGSSGLENCGNIAIYGGIVTAIGGYSGAGIGSGCMHSSCGNITIRGGIVTATGGYSGAGIGSGYQEASCGNITISGGYVKATAGNSANPIGAGYESSCGTVSINSSCTSVTDGSTRYINYLTPALDPTCTESGFAEHYIDPVSNTYYTALSFEQDKLIGDATALVAWKAENGGGYVAPLGHDWQFVDETIHQCARCETTTAHTGADDFVCDDCGGILLETAIAVTKAQGEAKAALTAAVGEKPSNTLAAILSDACAVVDAAMTLDGVASAKEQGLSDVAAQKATELEARRAAFLPECERILESDEYSDRVKSMVQEFVRGLNAAETLEEIDRVADMFAPTIQLRMARDHWIAELEALSPEEPSATVTAIIEDACELIENDTDMWAFTYVYDITCLAVERQLAAEATEELLEQTEEDLAEANEAITALNAIIASKEATIAEKQAALDTAAEQLNAAQANLETAQASIEELESTVAEQEDALAQAATGLEDKQAAVEAAQKALDEAKAKVTELESMVSEKDKALTQNEQEIQDLQAEIERLKALLDDDPTEPQPTETGTEPTATGTGADEGMLGDANGDNAVNMKDVLLLRKYLADMTDDLNLVAADVNVDGTVNMKDVLMLRKYLADMIDKLGA